MLHNVTEFEIRDGLIASYDLKTNSKQIIFRIHDRSFQQWKALAVANVSEHLRFGVQECYTEATMMKGNTTIEDFRVLFENLKYHIAWYRRTFDGKLIPYVVDEIYMKNRYGSKLGLIKRAAKLNKERL